MLKTSTRVVSEKTSLDDLDDLGETESRVISERSRSDEADDDADHSMVRIGKAPAAKDYFKRQKGPNGKAVLKLAQAAIKLERKDATAKAKKKKEEGRAVKVMAPSTPKEPGTDFKELFAQIKPYVMNEDQQAVIVKRKSGISSFKKLEMLGYDMTTEYTKRDGPNEPEKALAWFYLRTMKLPEGLCPLMDAAILEEETQGWTLASLKKQLKNKDKAKQLLPFVVAETRARVVKGARHYKEFTVLDSDVFRSNVFGDIRKTWVFRVLFSVSSSLLVPRRGDTTPVTRLKTFYMIPRLLTEDLNKRGELGGFQQGFVFYPNNTCAKTQAALVENLAQTNFLLDKICPYMESTWRIVLSMTCSSIHKRLNKFYPFNQLRYGGGITKADLKMSLSVADPSRIIRDDLVLCCDIALRALGANTQVRAAFDSESKMGTDLLGPALAGLAERICKGPATEEDWNELLPRWQSVVRMTRYAGRRFRGVHRQPSSCKSWTDAEDPRMLFCKALVWHAQFLQAYSKRQAEEGPPAHFFDAPVKILNPAQISALQDLARWKLKDGFKATELVPFDDIKGLYISREFEEPKPLSPNWHWIVLVDAVNHHVIRINTSKGRIFAPKEVGLAAIVVHMACAHTKPDLPWSPEEMKAGIAKFFDRVKDFAVSLSSHKPPKKAGSCVGSKRKKS